METFDLHEMAVGFPYAFPKSTIHTHTLTSTTHTHTHNHTHTWKSITHTHIHTTTLTYGNQLHTHIHTTTQTHTHTRAAVFVYDIPSLALKERGPRALCVPQEKLAILILTKHITS